MVTRSSPPLLDKACVFTSKACDAAPLPELCSVGLKTLEE